MNSKKVNVTKLEREINDYLLCKVGDLLVVGQAEAQPEGGWLFPILYGNAWQGMLGQVGTLQVSGEGEIRPISADERRELLEQVRKLAMIG